MEERIFIELCKFQNGEIYISVGGGSENAGQIESFPTIETAVEEIKRRANLDYKKMKEN